MLFGALRCFWVSFSVLFGVLGELFGVFRCFSVLFGVFG